MTTLTATVHGRVQGVGYRAYVHSVAGELGMEVHATNMSSGEVVVEASGTRELLEKLITHLHEGPPHALVENVEVAWS